MKKISRRLFCRNAGLSSMMLAMHPFGACSQPLRSDQTLPNEPLILELKLHTSAPLDIMKEFYVHQLDLELISLNSKELTVMAGATPLTLLNSDTSENPWYHFAFNIPENKIRLARDWQRERTSLVALGSHLEDPLYPDDVVHFRHWNAHSVFFWDPAGNLLEHIARHDLNNSGSKEFTSSDILYISEIGLIVDNVTYASKYLRESLRIDNYKGGSDKFTALGDANGLVIMMKTGRNLGGKKASTHPAHVKLDGMKKGHIKVPDYPYILDS